MAIRLNKVLTELNIGLQTAVDFLKNNKSLGEIKDDANLSTKISDEQYDALKSHFNTNKIVFKQTSKTGVCFFCTWGGKVYDAKKGGTTARPNEIY